MSVTASSCGTILLSFALYFSGGVSVVIGKSAQWQRMQDQFGPGVRSISPNDPQQSMIGESRVSQEGRWLTLNGRQRRNVIEFFVKAHDL